MNLLTQFKHWLFGKPPQPSPCICGRSPAISSTVSGWREYDFSVYCPFTDCSQVGPIKGRTRSAAVRRWNLVRRQLWPVLLLLGAFLIGPSAARAATEITAVLWLTNNPAGRASNVVINIGAADTRYPTNNTAGVESTHWQVTNTIAWARSNLFLHLGNYKVFTPGSSPQPLTVNYSATNSAALELIAPLNTNITVTLGAGWAQVSYFTNNYTDANPILTPTNAMSPRVRTNAENAIVNLLARNGATNKIPPNARAFQHYTDNTTSQSVSNKTLVAPAIQGGTILHVVEFRGTNAAITNVVIRHVVITGGDYSGYISSLTNGTLYSNLLHYARLANPTTTNLVNYGNAIRSEGPGANSFQAGSNALAAGVLAMAIGNGAFATNNYAAAIGNEAMATNENALSVGNLSIAGGYNSFAIGLFSFAGGMNSLAISGEATGGDDVAIGGISSGTNSVTLGYSSSASAPRTMALGPYNIASHAGSAAIGPMDHLGNYVETTDTNQIRAGTANHTVSVPGNLEVGGKVQLGTSTNNIWRGTNILNGRLDLTPRSNTSLANGYNSGTVLGTNTFIQISGASGPCTNASFAAPGGPAFYWLEVDNPGLSYTIKHESGLEPTPANRVDTGTGGDLSSTNRTVLIQIGYVMSASRWRIWSFR